MLRVQGSQKGNLDIFSLLFWVACMSICTISASFRMYGAGREPYHGRVLMRIHREENLEHYRLLPSLKIFSVSCMRPELPPAFTSPLQIEKYEAYLIRISVSCALTTKCVGGTPWRIRTVRLGIFGERLLISGVQDRAANGQRICGLPERTKCSASPPSTVHTLLCSDNQQRAC